MHFPGQREKHGIWLPLFNCKSYDLISGFTNDKNHVGYSKKIILPGHQWHLKNLSACGEILPALHRFASLHSHR
jgi:hypothetical protein